MLIHFTSVGGIASLRDATRNLLPLGGVPAFGIAFSIRVRFDIGIVVYLGASGVVLISVLWVILCSLSPNQTLQTINNGKIPKSISWQQL